MYTKWIWTNQMTNAMCDLEGQIGTNRLERMSPDRLFAEVLRVYGEDATAGTELARLTDWYIRNFADILFEALRKLTVDQLELILLLRRKQRERLVVLGDLGTLVDRLIRKPKDIYSIPARQFEEVMAFALAESGYDDVRLTPPTRDGGYDIEAIRKGPTCHRLLVECKRYAYDRKVGRPTLDALLGVLQCEKANQALLATTSSFSKDALELFKLEPWRLQGMDIENVLKLLRQARQKET
jgi:restriction system protein